MQERRRQDEGNVELSTSGGAETLLSSVNHVRDPRNRHSMKGGRILGLASRADTFRQRSKR